MPEPLHTDLIFPSQPSLSSLLTSLRHTTLTIPNRLRSIDSDSDFITRAALALNRPVVANERCGSWYVDPAIKAGSAYFKSTDGHERAWKFSTRRLNFHLLPIIEAGDGAVIVDSTRRGKRMPDALSSTIPIWCTVLNMTLLPNHPLSRGLFLPPHLPETTHAQITALLPSFVSSLQALSLPLPTITKPLRPFWITQESHLPNEPMGTIYEDYRPVVCCTASRRVVGSEMDEGGYVQGAGDDTENWACGLTPPIWWRHKDELLQAQGEEAQGLIGRLVDEAQGEGQGNCLRIAPRIYVDTNGASVPENYCHVALLHTSTPRETWVKSPNSTEVGLGKHKTAARNLRLALPDISTFVTKFLSAQEGHVVVTCDSGRDLSVGTGLALSCLLFDDEGARRTGVEEFTKTKVKKRLGGIMTEFPDANPSRTTLQSVNSFLMDWRG